MGGPVRPVVGATIPGLADSTSKAAPIVSLSASAPCTVYVGRISTEVSDDFVKALLEKCGKISKWNRAADPNTSKLTSFGFCDFEEPQGVYRALEFLHEKQLCDKRLLVKCEEKAKQTIDDWKQSRRAGLADAKAKKQKTEGNEKDGVVSLDDGPAVVAGLTDAELDDELRKESKDIEDEVAKLLAEKNKGYPEVKLDGAGDDKKDDKPITIDDKEEKPFFVEKKSDKDADKDAKAPSDAKPPEPQRSKSEEARLQKEKELEAKRKSAVSKNYRPSRRERERERRLDERERDIEKEFQYRIREFERNEGKRIDRLKRDLEQLDKETGPNERDKRRSIDRDLAWGKSDRDIDDWKRRREDRARERQREREKDDADRAAEQKDIDEQKKKKADEEAARQKELEDQERAEREAKEAEIARVKAEEERKRKDAEDAERAAIE